MFQKAMFIFAVAALPLSMAWAEEDDRSRTTGDASEMMGGRLEDEGVSVKPLVGVVAYKAPGSTENESRLAAGLSMDANVVRWIDKDWSRVYVGPSTGLIYSHLGESNSNLIGTDGDGTGQGGANMLIIPANAKIGYGFSDVRVALHGGGNVMYRSIPNAINTGVQAGDSDWSFFPNAGLDFDVAFSDTVALTLRPDWTFTDQDDVFTGTVGLGISLG